MEKSHNGTKLQMDRLFDDADDLADIRQLTTNYCHLPKSGRFLTG